MIEKTHDNTLEECQEEVKRLKEENQHLRASASAFGELAERLKVALDVERRSGADRRREQRAGQDRRSASASG
jgi:predicted RNase H-like nuclease (RuvC/YqgF family)